MEKETFNRFLDDHAPEIEAIKERAHQVHADVNQHYDGKLPYSVHLDAVVAFVKQYGYLVCSDTHDIIPMIFGAYFHDSIEDARLTYNNVMRIACEMMEPDQAYMATEIAYALTNEKGRTRAERADDRYYAGIRSTPYAPLCKFADRLANVSYTIEHQHDGKPGMRDVYAHENAHFTQAILGAERADDPRTDVPDEMVKTLERLLQ